jgi:hypothetical protein
MVLPTLRVKLVALRLIAVASLLASCGSPGSSDRSNLPGVRAGPEDSHPTAEIAVFVLQLRPDGTVAKATIAKSTGNARLDAITAKGLSAMRFPDEMLTPEERAKRQTILRLPITQELLRDARYTR